MGNNDLKLPERYSVSNLGRVSEESSREILDYCDSCLKRDSCKMNLDLRNQMTNGFVSTWPREFVFIEAKKDDYRSVIRPICIKYSDNQERLAVNSEYCDGIERLKRILEEERKKEVV